MRNLADPIRVDSSNPADPMAQLAVVLLALFGQMERTYMLERAAHARAVAIATGRRIGRPSVVDPDKLAYAVHLREQGDTIGEIVAKTGITRSSLYRRVGYWDVLCALGARHNPQGRCSERPRTWELVTVDPRAAKRAANVAGLVTLPIGLALVAAPARASRVLRVGPHQVAALRVIGVLDLALVPGLLLDGGRWQWLTARAGLNMGIAAYCFRLLQQERAPTAMLAMAAMLTATVADTRASAALHRAAQR